MGLKDWLIIICASVWLVCGVATSFTAIHCMKKDGSYYRETMGGLRKIRFIFIVAGCAGTIAAIYYTINNYFTNPERPEDPRNA